MVLRQRVHPRRRPAMPASGCGRRQCGATQRATCQRAAALVNDGDSAPMGVHGRVVGSELMGHWIRMRERERLFGREGWRQKSIAN